MTAEERRNATIGTVTLLVILAFVVWVIWSVWTMTVGSVLMLVIFFGLGFGAGRMWR